MQQIARTIGQWCVYLFVATVPFGVSVVLATPALFGEGVFAPYRSHLFYLSEFFLLCGVSMFLISGVKNMGRARPFFPALVIFFATYGISLFFSVFPEHSVWYLLRAGEFFALYLLLVSGVVDRGRVLWVLVGAMVGVACIGIVQFFLQHSLGVPFLGESLIGPEVKGVAKLVIWDEVIVRAYATFPHPNVFVAYLLFALCALIFELRQDLAKKWQFWGMVAVLAGALFATLSKAALLVAFVLAFWRIWPRYRSFGALWRILFWSGGVACFAFIVLLFRLHLDSLWERILYGVVSIRMFIAHPFGVGAGNFTAVMQEFTEHKLFPWLLQPVHSIYLLAFAELGVVGGGAVCALCVSFFRKISQLPWMVRAFGIVVFGMGLFDHFFLSLYQGQFLWWFFFAYASVHTSLSQAR